MVSKHLCIQLIYLSCTVIDFRFTKSIDGWLSIGFDGHGYQYNQNEKFAVLQLFHYIADNLPPELLHVNVDPVRHNNCINSKCHSKHLLDTFPNECS